jgi:hypothetical protein
MTRVDAAAGQFVPGEIPPNAKPVVEQTSSSALFTVSDADIMRVLMNVDASGQGSGGENRLAATGMSAPATQSVASGDAYRAEIADRSAQPFDLAAVSAVFLEFMLSYRQAARVDREGALDAQISAMMSSAEQIRTAAKDQYQAELVQAIFSFVGSAVQIGFAGMQIKSVNSMRNEIRAQETEANVKLKNQPSEVSLEASSQAGAPKAAGQPKIDSAAGSEPEAKAAESNRKSARNQEEVAEEIKVSNKAQDAAGSRESVQESEIDMMAQGLDLDMVSSEVSLEASSQAGAPKAAAKPKIDSAAESEPEAEAPANPNETSPVDPPAFRAYQARIDAAAQMGQVYNQLGGALSALSNVPGKIWGEALKAQSAEESARGKEYDAASKRAEAAYGNANDTMQNAREAFNKMLDMQADIQRTVSETARSITRI